MVFALKVNTNMTDFIIKKLPYDLFSELINTVNEF